MKLLAIVSTDYGELGNALYFLQGLNLAERPILMLPAALENAVPPRPDLHSIGYATLGDIRRCICAAEPDAVMLFSGYLLMIGKRFSLFNALLLVRWLRARGTPVLTSDPFLGLLNGPAALDFTAVVSGTNVFVRRLRSAMVALRLRALGRRLKGCMHVYPAPIERLHEPVGTTRLRGYFNAAALRIPEPTSEVRTWIFVLSDIDYRIQAGRLGKRFALQVVDRLREAAALAGCVVLVAPAQLLSAIGAALGSDSRISMHERDSYPAFMARLMSAEYAFFWNLYSFSLLHRVLARRPVMFFAEGHMVNILPALREAGICLFYDGWRPPLLAMDAPLRIELLESHAREARARFAAIAQAIGRCDDPLTLLHEAISANQRDVLDA